MFNKYLKYEKQTVKVKFPWPKILMGLVLTIVLIFGFVNATPNFQTRGLKYLFSNLSQFGNWADRHFGDGTVYSSKEVFTESISLMWQTIMISISGTVIGLLLAIPLSFLASKTTTLKPFVYLPSRVFLSFIRAVPPLIFAYVFAVYLSPSLAGVLTMAIFVATIMSKWLYEIIDTIPQAAKDSFISAGGTKINAFLQVTLLQIRTRFMILAFYTFEQVVRFASILGVVGIVGIGLLFERFSPGNEKNWGMLGIVIMVIIITIVILEFFTFLVKKFILSYKGKTMDSQTTINGVKLNEGYRKYMIWALIILFFSATIYALSTIVWAKTTNNIDGSPFRNLMSPDWDLIFNFDNALNPLKLAFSSLGVVVMSLLIGVIFALPIGLLASSKVTGRYVSLVFKFLIIVIRSMPVYIWAVWTILISNGNKFAFAGALALGIQSIGMLGKMVSESANSVSNDTILSMRASGASKMQVLFHATLPAIMPLLVSKVLYRLEINFKLLIQIGIFGASVFGFEFNNNLKNPANFSAASSFILVNVFFVLIIEQISNVLRLKIVSGRWFQNDYKMIFKKCKIIMARYW